MKIRNEQILRSIFGKVEIETIIKRLEGKPLKQTERNYLSRSIKPKLIAAKLLTKDMMLEKIQRPDKSLDNKIAYNLSCYGYEIINLEAMKKQKLISIEELIAIILTKIPKARYIEAIPILLLKNKINKYKLIEISLGYGIKNKLGYIIEITTIIAKKFKIKKDLNELLKYFRDNKEKNIEYLGEERDFEYKEFLLKTSTKRIKKWNLLGRFFDADFIKNAEVYLW